MLILVDGPDCARKSTLVTALLRVLRAREPVERVRSLHARPPRAHPLDEYVTPLLSYRVSTSEHVICDRWHLGELVYPAVFDRPTQLDDAVFRYVELFLQARGALLVVITPEVAELRDCLTRRGDDLVDDSQVEAARDGFVRAATRTRLPLVWLKDETVDVELARWLVDEAMSTTVSALDLRPFVTYVGPHHPRVLLLGDVRRTGSEPGDLRPAFMPYGGTSGHYLLRALADVDDVGIANACDVDSPFALWQVLGAPDAVALGRNAERRAPGLRYVPHPQWQRRFQHHHLDEYRSQLLGA